MLLYLLLACSGGEPEDTGPVYDPDPPTELGGDRPAPVSLPADYTVDHSWPLVILLHGYGATATLQDAVFGLGPRQDEAGFILVKPEGTVDQGGFQFWNATPECCDFWGTGVDDSGYLSGLITEARTLYPISTVQLVGHSNGGFMSYRMACDHPDQLDGIVVLAGSTFYAESGCTGTEPMSVVHVHGTADDTVYYTSEVLHAGAEESVQRWADKAHCGAATDTGTEDYLTSVSGEETTISQYSGCDAGIDVQLWTAEGGSHYFLDNTTAFKDDVVAWLMR